jgi:large subunit ribosomal protein L4
MSLDNAQVGTVDLMPEVFKLEEINKHLIWEAVRHFLARRRAGTASTKSKWEVSGSGRKLWKQKGTGRARVGSIRSPLWRHGGIIHGPQPRSYDYQFPRKKLLGALRSALASKLSDGKLTVVENFEVGEAKTKAMRQALDALKVESTALLVDSARGENRNLELSSRNLEGVELVLGHEVHPYHLLRYDRAIFSRPALEKLQASLKATVPKRRAEEVA